jgi:hypothetical protein
MWDFWRRTDWAPNREPDLGGSFGWSGLHERELLCKAKDGDADPENEPMGAPGTFRRS